MTTQQNILEKYTHIIAEEVNVKEVHLLPDTMQVTKTYIPLGNKLSAAFGKDTGKIIGAAKQGNVKELEDGNIKVMHEKQERILDNTQYEIRYSGLTGEHQIVEDGVIVELDLTITSELKTEGLARELSRFLNQMRKDADYQVNDRVACTWNSESKDIEKAIESFGTFLQTEALLSNIIKGESSGDVTNTFETEEGSVVFVLKR